MKENRITSFAEFWPFYLRQHRDPRSRVLHYCGSLCALTFLGVGAWQGNGLICLGALPAGYGPAWIGHFFLEKNRPATFQYPFYSLAADFVMLFRFLTGSLNKHLKDL